MGLDDFKTAWQRQPSDPDLDRPKEEIMGELARAVGDLRRTSERRDTAEILGGLLAAVLASTFFLSRTTLARGLGVLLTGSLLLLVVGSLWTRRRRPEMAIEGFDQSLLEFSRREVAHLERLVRRLHALLWLLLVVCTLVWVPIFGNELGYVRSRENLLLVVTLIAFTFWLGRWVFQRRLVPLRRRKAELSAELEEGHPSNGVENRPNTRP